jgi:hypothetical protein
MAVLVALATLLLFNFYECEGVKLENINTIRICSTYARVV